MNEQIVPAVSLFSSVRRRERQVLAGLADTVAVPAGKVLTREGALAQEFFVILDGTASASRDGEQVARLGPGDFFGEIGLLDGPRRTATVVATTPMELVVTGRREFRSMLHAFPGIRAQVERAASERTARHRAPLAA